MIEVFYDRARGTLSARGHAGYDVPGRDIVCAAATTLVLTLAHWARERGSREIRLLPGDLSVAWDPGGPVAPVAEAAAQGLEALAERYPVHVSYSCKEDP